MKRVRKFPRLHNLGIVWLKIDQTTWNEICYISQAFKSVPVEPFQ